MKHRPGVTLLEVLVSIFIMGIGMLALLTLFPLGAISMAQALKDDRVTSAAAEADATAVAWDVRHDAAVTTAFNSGPAAGTFAAGSPIGPGYPVYVDPYYAVLAQASLGSSPPTTPGIRRVAPTTMPAPFQRWFTLLDDLTYTNNGVADVSSGLVQREGRYTWAYMLRRTRTSQQEVIDMAVVVYSGRSTQIAEGETTFAATGAAGTTSVSVNYGGAVPKPNITRTGWILDTTYETATDGEGNNFGTVHGDFYRVVNVTDAGPNTVVLELQTPIKNPVNPANAANTISSIVVMENVSEVIEKGSNWRP